MAAVLLLAGCVETVDVDPSAAPPDAPAPRIRVRASSSAPAFEAGDAWIASFMITNDGSPVDYWADLCGEPDLSDVLSIRVWDSSGSQVDPRRPWGPNLTACLAPMFHKTLAHGETVTATFPWDGRAFRDSDDEAGSWVRPGRYTLDGAFHFTGPDGAPGQAAASAAVEVWPRSA